MVKTKLEQTLDELEDNLDRYYLKVTNNNLDRKITKLQPGQVNNKYQPGQESNK